MKKRRSSERFLSGKREHKAARRARRELRRAEVKAREREREAAKGWPLQSYVLRLTESVAKGAVRSASRKQVEVVVPETFSFTRNPEAVLRTIAQMRGVATNFNVREIYFDHSALVSYELAAEAVLDVIVREVSRERRRRARSLSLVGVYPTNEDAARFIKGIGISHHLEVENTELPKQEQDKLVIFERHRRAASAPGVIADQKGVVIQEFVEYVDKCLATIDREMTHVGRAKLCEYTGEIIDNVEQHASSQHWYLAGYLDISLHPPMCEVVIFNFGKTFAETFSELHPASFPRQQVGPYIERHQTQGWFSPSWTQEDLLTLVALQGGVSSKAVDQNDTRGQGTVELIRFFQDVCSEYHQGERKAEMALVSGSTHIRFDGTYGLRQDSMGRWTIAFNQSNTLADPPDRKYVRHLQDAFFPGTVVSIRFPVERTAPAG